MGKVKLKWKRGALEKIRHDKRAIAFLEKKAKQVAKEAGGEELGYKVTYLAAEKPRGAVSVMATGHASYHNRKYHSLLRALSNAREKR